MDTMNFGGREYRVVKRIAHVNELIITTPDIYNYSSALHTIHEISLNTPYLVNDSRSSIVYFRNEHAKNGGNCLNHSEYYVLEPIEKVRPIRTKIGEEVTVKKFLGITFYKKIKGTYVFDHEEG